MARSAESRATCVAVSCTPGEIKECRGDMAFTCDPTGNGYALESCDLSCADTPTPHCKYLQPKYLPDVCETSPSTVDMVVSSSGMLDPNLDSNCTGGVVTVVCERRCWWRWRIKCWRHQWECGRGWIDVGHDASRWWTSNTCWWHRGRWRDRWCCPRNRHAPNREPELTRGGWRQRRLSSDLHTDGHDSDGHAIARLARVSTKRHRGNSLSLHVKTSDAHELRDT